MMMIMMLVVMTTTTMMIRNKDSHTDIYLLLIDMGINENKGINKIVQEYDRWPVILIIIIQFFGGISFSFC